MKVFYLLSIICAGKVNLEMKMVSGKFQPLM